MVRKKYNNLKQILLLASVLTVFFSLSVNAQKLPLPPDGLPQGYETWAVVYDFPNRTITMEQKLNADFWKQNLTEPIPPIWWFNEVLGRSYPESSPYDQQIVDAQHRGDWATELELKQKYINELGITVDEQAEVTSQWLDRNPYHNLSYFALGVTDKKTRTFMSNQNPDDPFSPFAKEGENIMVVEVLEDNVSGIMELTDWDITKIGLFEQGFTVFGGEDYIRGLVEKAQKAKFFLGVSWRENNWESYSGFKVGGIFGIAIRTIAPANGVCGSANGETFSTLSSGSSRLCNPGTVINFSGSGPWTWMCQGLGGGTTASCSANFDFEAPTFLTFPVYRFSLKSSPAKFYTIYESEKDYVMQNLSYEYTYDGIAFYAYQRQQPGTFPVYRFSLKSSPAKFYTIYESEKDYVMQNLSYEYSLDGVAFYGYQGQ